jgi:hypothetical protein
MPSITIPVYMIVYYDFILHVSASIQYRHLYLNKKTMGRRITANIKF